MRGRQIFTSELVLSEYLDGSADWGEYRQIAAASFVHELEWDGIVHIVPSSHKLFVAALALYESRPDKEWSLTDCSSILICEKEGIKEVLTHDRHFAQAGLIVLLRAD